MKERNIAIFNLIKQNNIKFKISVSTKFLYAAMASRHTTILQLKKLIAKFCVVNIEDALTE